MIKQPKESDSKLLQQLVERKNQLSNDLKDGKLAPSVYTQGLNEIIHNDMLKLDKLSKQMAAAKAESN